MMPGEVMYRETQSMAVMKEKGFLVVFYARTAYTPVVKGSKPIKGLLFSVVSPERGGSLSSDTVFLDMNEIPQFIAALEYLVKLGEEWRTNIKDDQVKEAIYFSHRRLKVNLYKEGANAKIIIKAGQAERTILGTGQLPILKDAAEKTLRFLSEQRGEQS